MKYIVLITVVVAVIFTQPWEYSFAGSFSSLQDTVASPLPDSVSEPENPAFLLPIGKILSNSNSDIPEADLLDKIIEKFMRKWEIRGASFALMKEGQLLYSKGYGYADLESGVLMNTHHILRIASVSKLITAVGIMKLEEDGKLKLSDRVFGKDGILDETDFPHIKDPRARQITVEHLLRHQGGFSVVYGDPMFCPVDIARKMDVPAPADLHTTIRFVLSRRLGYTPGCGTIYSNIGYGILSKVIEKVSGTDYESYIARNILEPAGCFDMRLGRNLYEERYENEVRYYENSAQPELVQACDGSGLEVPKYYGGNNIEGLSGAGGWVASASELLRFLAVIDGKPGIPDILKPETIARITAYNAHSLPIGWMNTTPRGDWSRTGTLSGTSALLKQQHDGYAWVFITNTSCWKGHRFSDQINTMLGRALSSVEEWPKKDLFELQRFKSHDYLVSQ